MGQALRLHRLAPLPVHSAAGLPVQCDRPAPPTLLQGLYLLWNC